MKHRSRASRPSNPSIIAAALTWDGARWPIRSLPPAARAFLAAKSAAIPKLSPIKIAGLFACDAVQEIRLCWVPRLAGGSDVLSAPFKTPDDLRLGFRAGKPRRFGEVLGIVYRRHRKSARSARVKIQSG